MTKMALKIIIKPEMLNGKKNTLEKQSVKQIIKDNAEVFKKLE